MFHAGFFANLFRLFSILPTSSLSPFIYIMSKSMGVVRLFWRTGQMWDCREIFQKCQLRIACDDLTGHINHSCNLKAVLVSVQLTTYKKFLWPVPEVLTHGSRMRSGKWNIQQHIHPLPILPVIKVTQHCLHNRLLWDPSKAWPPKQAFSISVLKLTMVVIQLLIKIISFNISEIQIKWNRLPNNS